MAVLLGAIADDFTGATDLADTLAAHGMRSVQLIGVPNGGEVHDADAVIVALKTRSIDPGDAVAQSLRALAYLTTLGAHVIFFKYCSTFDSTPRGNIGPVGDALAQALGQTIAVFCPAYPANGRSIFRGYLFVGDVLLSESGMRDHPLNPMHDANLVRVLAAQSTRRIVSIGLHEVRSGPQALRAALAREAQHGPAHAIVDATQDDDLQTIGRALDGEKLVTGGAGIAQGLPENFRRRGLLDAATDAVVAPVRGGRALILAGSASTATREQVAQWRRARATFDVTEAHLADPAAAIAAIVAWASSAPGPVLVTAGDDPANVRRNQERFGVAEAGRRVEAILAGAGRELAAAGFRRIVVAGGETSGAVVSALGIERLRIGPRIAAGVPWTVTEGLAPLGLALKSGNFGAPDFFAHALEMTD